MTDGAASRSASRSEAPELLLRDLEEIATASEGDLRRFSRARLYVTGGTGFVGKWLLRAVAHANRRLNTQIRLDVLTRDPKAFCAYNPDIAEVDGIRLLRGDVVAPVSEGRYDGVIHAAATSGTAVPPGETLRTIVDGARAVIRDVIAPSGEIPVLFISSGGVYGIVAPEFQSVSEEYRGAPNQLDVHFTYHESKRLAELAFAIAHEERSAAPKIARLFAFLGPGVPLDAHFAAGNFIRDALNGGPIRVKSGGTAVRTYLYPTDMIVWCLAVLGRGVAGRAYNVGSDESVSIRMLAERIAASVDPRASIELSRSAGAMAESRYVPDVRRITEELGVCRSIGLDESIVRTIAFHRALGAG